PDHRPQHHRAGAARAPAATSGDPMGVPGPGRFHLSLVLLVAYRPRALVRHASAVRRVPLRRLPALAMDGRRPHRARGELGMARSAETGPRRGGAILRAGSGNRRRAAPRLRSLGMVDTDHATLRLRARSRPERLLDPARGEHVPDHGRPRDHSRALLLADAGTGLDHSLAGDAGTDRVAALLHPSAYRGDLDPPDAGHPVPQLDALLGGECRAYRPLRLHRPRVARC